MDEGVEGPDDEVDERVNVVMIEIGCACVLLVLLPGCIRDRLSVEE